jgi:hypothetical protein
MKPYLPTFNVYRAKFIATFENGEEIEDELEFGYYRRVTTVAGQEYLVKREARNKYRGYKKKYGLLIDVTVLEFVKVEGNDTEGA